MTRDESLLVEYKKSKKRYIEDFYKSCLVYVKNSNKENVDYINHISCVGKMVKDYDEMIKEMEEDLHDK